MNAPDKHSWMTAEVVPERVYRPYVWAFEDDANFHVRTWTAFEDSGDGDAWRARRQRLKMQRAISLLRWEMQAKQREIDRKYPSAEAMRSKIVTVEDPPPKGLSPSAEYVHSIQSWHADGDGAAPIQGLTYTSSNSRGRRLPIDLTKK